MISAVKIQSLTRQWLVQETFSKMKGAVVKLQCMTRCYLARQTYKLLWEAQNRFVQTSAARTIQASWRGYLAQNQFQVYKTRTLQLQAFFRGYLVRNHLYHLDCAATVIQTAVRCIIAKRRFYQAIHATKLLQSQWRGFSVWSMFQRKKTLCIKMQALVRRYLARRVSGKLQYQAILDNGKCLGSEYSNSAAKIQDTWRRYRRNKESREIVLLQQLSTIKIQSLTRRFLCVTQLRQMAYAALMIQTMWRSYRSRTEFLVIKSSATKIVAIARGFIAQRKARAVFELRSMVQLLTKEALRLKKQQNLCSIQIQAVWRSWRDQKEYQKTKANVLNIQAIVRGHFIRNQHRIQQQSIIMLQSFIRQKIRRSSFLLCKRGIRLLQSRFRDGRLREENRQIQNSVTILQAFVRGSLLRKYNRKRHSAASQIQRHWRGFSVVCQIQRQQMAARLLQSTYRGVRFRKEFEKLQRSACAIQKLWRGIAARTCYELDYIDIVISQSQVRVWLASRKLDRKKKEIENIQSVMAIKIQSLYRRYKTRCHFLHEHAARIIQKSWRCYTVHVDFMATMLSIHALQAHCRSFLEIKRFNRVKRQIITIQSFARMAVQKSAFVRQVQMAVKIQSHTRGFHVRNSMAVKHFSVTQIQKCWRGFIPRSDFMIIILMAVKIQAFFRMKLAQKRVDIIMLETKTWPDAAIKIQKVFRGYQSRSQVERREKRIILLQSLGRGFLVRRRDRRKTVKTLRSRINHANHVAKQNPKLLLCHRTFAALEVLQKSTRLSEIMNAVCALEFSTRYSENCCKKFCEARAPDILFRAIRTLNRSRPHIELLGYILKTLTNIAKYDMLLTYVASLNAAEVFLDLIQMFRDKDDIFYLTVALLDRCVRFDDEILVSLCHGCSIVS